jgi:hypothetical protein
MPAPTTPKEGDFYIDDDTLAFYVYESGDWVLKGYLSPTEV